jgi:hypothetical protein
MTTKDRREKFLAELTKISRQFGIVVDGCGCCGSPYLREIDEGAAGEYVEDGGISDFEWKEAA